MENKYVQPVFLQNELESYARFTTHHLRSNLSNLSCNKWGCSKLRDYWLLIWEGAEHSTFEGGYGWFQKKISFKLISRGKNIFRKEIPAIQSLCMSGKKILSPRSLGKKFLPKRNHPYPPSLKSQMVGPQSYAGVTPSTGHVSLWCETSLPWVVKRQNIYRFCWKKWRTTLYFLQQPDLLEDSFDSLVIKREIALFNSCWSNVAKSAKQVVCFCWRF